jgi:hypothetical protein
MSDRSDPYAMPDHVRHDRQIEHRLHFVIPVSNAFVIEPESSRWFGEKVSASFT